jgi:hypothetical protein
MNELIISTSKVSSELLSWSNNVITVNTNSEDSLFTGITKCGLEMEHVFLDRNKSLLWNKSASYDIAAIVWDNHVPLLEPMIKQWSTTGIRGDELVFPTLHMDVSRHWVIGHPRALIKWSSCVTHIEDIDYIVFPQHSDHPNTRPTSRLVWIAHRIGLKVYGAE